MRTANFSNSLSIKLQYNGLPTLWFNVLVFKPSSYTLRLVMTNNAPPSTYYRSCWHVVSPGFSSDIISLFWSAHRLYSYHSLHNLNKFFISAKPWFRLAPIDQYSPLLPTAGFFSAPVWLDNLSTQLEVLGFKQKTHLNTRFSISNPSKRVFFLAQAALFLAFEPSAHPPPASVLVAYSQTSTSRLLK